MAFTPAATHRLCSLAPSVALGDWQLRLHHAGTDPDKREILGLHSHPFLETVIIEHASASPAPGPEPDLREAMALPVAVSAARCLMGPQVRVRGLSARVCLPSDHDAGFGWHIHHRVWCDPVPAWFSPPQALDALIYLDVTRTGAGRTEVLPGSHREPLRTLPWDDQTPQAGEIVVDADAGDVVLMHTHLWHRALPATTTGQLRRLLILGLIPSWYRGCPYGDAEGLLALAKGYQECDRLCGDGGYI